MSISEAQYRDMLARTERSRMREPATATEGPECELHDQIEAELRRLRWYFVHSRMDRKTTNAIGTPDFIIAAPRGITLWVEVKRKGGKPSTPQLAAAAMLKRNEHVHAFVWSAEEFLQLIHRL